MKPEEQWTPVDYWHDLHSEDHDLELDTYLRAANELAKYATELEAEIERLRERENTYCCIHKWIAENWPEALGGER